ncbi:cysteine proteinase [Viridothelium virens]|uniref:ubiquitinyl hydrolase 1 n=1 Tax=Viridothelium virens TaxID=1048519 RepID=A0A6A6HK98_VIRVR|nr:cysteine proteinase [Viridothelium virens]
MGLPSKISSPAAPCSKIRSSTSPKRAPKSSRASLESPDRVTKLAQKPSKIKQRKANGRHLQLIEANGDIIDSVAVPSNFNTKLKDLLDNAIHFQEANNHTESAPTQQDTKIAYPEPHGIPRRNTAFCYRLALLQALAHAPPFCTALRASKKFCGTHLNCNRNCKPCLACTLNRVLRCYWHASSDLDDAVRSFHGACRDTTSPSAWPYRASEHADIQEFLLWLGEVVRAQHPLASTFAATLDVGSEGSWSCRHCGRVHRKAEASLGLSVGISVPRRGLDLLSYLREDMAEVVEVRCDAPRCRTNERRQRRVRFTKLPRVLFVHLKRFEYSPRRGPVKIGSQVKFPEILSLKEFVENGVDGTRYELMAYVAHQGNLEHGHYVAMVKGPRGISLVDDDRVQRKRDWYDFPAGFSPYLLVYVQK